MPTDRPIEFVLLPNPSPPDKVDPLCREMLEEVRDEFLGLDRSPSQATVDLAAVFAVIKDGVAQVDRSRAVPQLGGVDGTRRVIGFPSTRRGRSPWPGGGYLCVQNTWVEGYEGITETTHEYVDGFVQHPSGVLEARTQEFVSRESRSVPRELFERVWAEAVARRDGKDPRER